MDMHKEMPPRVDATTKEDYACMSNLLQEFARIPNIDKAWLFKSDNKTGLQGMFSICQPNLLANKSKRLILSCHILRESDNSAKFLWAPFPIEMSGVSLIVPSPSSSKLLVIRNPENESPSRFEIWSSSQMKKEFQIPQSLHGSVYNDVWFEGVSWNLDETFIAYAAEEPSPTKPIFNDLGYKKSGYADKDCGTWKGQGDWEEGWGETYARKRSCTSLLSTSTGATKLFEAIFMSSKSKKNDVFDPIIMILHGRPHDVSLSYFSKSWAFLSLVRYSLLIVNYRGSLGFGEEALQSLPGKVGSQDVNDVLSAIDHVINLGVATPSKIIVMGISHGGFLTAHLIGQAPEKFVTAAAINPICNLALMVGTTEIPNWCYKEASRTRAKNCFREASSPERLTLFHNKSPISHTSKVLKIYVFRFMMDCRAHSEFECFLNIAVWFKTYCK